MKKNANQKIWKMMFLLLGFGMFVFTACDPNAVLPQGGGQVDPGTNDDDPPVVVEGDWTKPINEPTIWSGKVTVKGTIYVNAGLTIKPGTVVTFREDAQLYVQNEGFIHAVGLADTIIVLKAYEEGADWESIYINENAGKSSKFAYCHISGAETAIAVYYNKVSIDNCVIKECSVNGVYLSRESELGSFTGNTISDCEEYPVVIPFLQATAVTSDNEISGMGILLDDYIVRKKNGKVTIHEQTIPYVMSYGEFDINDNAEVTIEPGVTIEMPEDGFIRVGQYTSGKLVAVGTAEKPITFTSKAKDKAAGDWEKIMFDEYAMKSSALKYCNIEYAGDGGDGAVEVYYTSVAIDSCTITNSSSYGVLVNSSEDGSFISFSGNVIKDTELYPVSCNAAAAGVITADNELGEMGIEISGWNLTKKVTWQNLNVPYTMRNYEFNINEGGSLTIMPGVTVLMTENGYIRVGEYTEGKLVAVGTEEEPIIFTSAMSDKWPGDWQGIQFEEYVTAGSILDHCKVLYGGRGGGANVDFYYTKGKVSLTNSEIAYSSNYGIRVRDDDGIMPTLSNNNYHDNGSHYIHGNEHADSDM